MMTAHDLRNEYIALYGLERGETDGGVPAPVLLQ